MIKREGRGAGEGGPETGKSEHTWVRLGCHQKAEDLRVKQMYLLFICLFFGWVSCGLFQLLGLLQNIWA